jgi:SpoVK/Ycf46/Vps4 family AAA+-type ATPase
MFLVEDGKYRLIDSDSVETMRTLKAGVYNMKVHSSMFSTTVNFEHNDMYKKGMNITTGIFQSIKEYIDNFFSEEMGQVREQLEMNNRLGLIFKGIPGTGKTYLAGQLAEKLSQEMNAIGILTTDFNEVDLSDLITSIRNTDEDPNRLIVLIMDEFEKKNMGKNSNFLSFMDGADSKDNMLIIATVNQTNNLPATLLERPGRFEHIFDFETEKEDVIKNIIKHMLPKEYHPKVNFDEFVKELMKNNKTTIDYIRIEIRNLMTSLLRNKNAETVQLKVEPHSAEAQAELDRPRHEYCPDCGNWLAGAPCDDCNDCDYDSDCGMEKAICMN